MRFYEISNGYRMPINEEESSIIDKIDNKTIDLKNLDEREAEVARLMVSRGLLHCREENGTSIYSANSALNVWRI